jgi:phenylacetyl-CoA:acceptor oxidoreductase 26-kDa subunit
VVARADDGPGFRLRLNPGCASGATPDEQMTMSFGPNPWQQTSWDARAAGNFMCGGAGAGLIVFTAIAGASGPALIGLMLAGLALVGLGLFCVFLETGRPLRAINVLFNPRTSWMSREAFAAASLFAVGAATVLGWVADAWFAAGLALVFVYCQARMLRAAKGIPAWRDPMIEPLIVGTGLCEGGGLFLLALPLHGTGTLWLLAIFGALLVVRMLVWFAYRRRLAGALAPGAAAALDRAGWMLQIAGTLVPLVLMAAIGVGAASGDQVPLLAAIAGLLAAAAGAYLKFTLVTRAGFNQGFALAHLPVRGQPR